MSLRERLAAGFARLPRLPRLPRITVRSTVKAYTALRVFDPGCGVTRVGGRP